MSGESKARAGAELGQKLLILLMESFRESLELKTATPQEKKVIAEFLYRNNITVEFEAESKSTGITDDLRQLAEDWPRTAGGLQSISARAWCGN
ncbi:hypothetical protein OMCYN_01642 [cyanobiont of Ornithocercus magnificus]|nr:hypothetical protein OMCYN_01642 [cyanobiont of Ornithocercus magnificus]